MTEETLKFFEKYRQMIEECNLLLKECEISRVHNLNVLTQFRNKEDEIRQMQNLMAYMIDHDMDPVQAKLTKDENEMAKWHWPQSEQAQSNLQGLQGAVGATGYNVVGGNGGLAQSTWFSNGIAVGSAIYPTAISTIK